MRLVSKEQWPLCRQRCWIVIIEHMCDIGLENVDRVFELKTQYSQKPNV